MTPPSANPNEAYNEWLAKALPRLPKETLVEASRRLLPASFKAGEIIIAQDDPPGLFYVVASGEVEVSRREPNGKVRILATLKPGEFFGEMGLVAETERSATVRARTDVKTRALSWDYFIMMIEASEDAYQDVWAIVRERERR